MPRLGKSGGPHYMRGQTTQGKCPWCQHEKCENCIGAQFLEVWLGCCMCGTTTMQSKWEQEGERLRVTNDRIFVLSSDL